MQNKENTAPRHNFRTPLKGEHAFQSSKVYKLFGNAQAKTNASSIKSGASQPNVTLRPNVKKAASFNCMLSQAGYSTQKKLSEIDRSSPA